MTKDTKTAMISVRCTSSLKQQILARAHSQKMEPSRYILSLIEADIERQVKEPTEVEKAFYEKILNQHTDKLLNYMSEIINKKLTRIAHSISGNEKEIQSIISEFEMRVMQIGKTVKETTKEEWYNRLKEAPSIAAEAKIISETVDAFIAGKKAKE